jgi:hypothetical protein
MKRFRLALITGAVATAMLVSSFWFYQAARERADFSRKKFIAIERVRTESRGYKQKLDSFNARWQTLGELSRDSAANVNYDISIEPSNFEDLNEKVVSTYEHGMFFLKSATLAGTPNGVRLAVTGFKKGGAQPDGTQQEGAQP